MKLLSFVIPCFNSMAFMEKCLDSLLIGGEDVEILIVNDGSTDETGAIADSYLKKYPHIVRVFHQKNAGHGGAINTGLKNSVGEYFKVVDSDDWVDAKAYLSILNELRSLKAANRNVDMFVSNYVYEKLGAKHKAVMSYKNALPEKRILTWKEIGKLRVGQYILMHSVIYRTAILRDCGLILPEHTFYVDNLYVYAALPYVTNIYYLNVDFYRYFIGREGQSVQEKTMVKRIDQQLRVNKLMIEQVDMKNIDDERQRSYLLSYLGIVTAISSTFLLIAGSPEHMKKKKQLWRLIKQKDVKLYKQLRYGVLGQLVHLPRSLGIGMYKIAQKIYGFN